MAEEIPRRLRRFQKKQEQEKPEREKAEQMSRDIFPQVEKKQITKKEITEMAVKEVRKFRQEKNRLPSQSEYSHIAEKIFNQIKNKYSLQGAKQREMHEQRTETQAREKPLNPAEERRNKRRMERESLEKKRKALQPEQMPEKTGKRHHERRTQEQTPQSMEQKTEQPKIEAVSLKELLGEKQQQKTKQKQKGMEQFSLEGMEILNEGIEPLEEEHVTKEIDSKNSCPNCGNKTSHIIFCPDCGNAFCAHCAKTAVREGEMVKYTCPKCGREIKLKH